MHPRGEVEGSCRNHLREPVLAPREQRRVSCKEPDDFFGGSVPVEDAQSVVIFDEGRECVLRFLQLLRIPRYSRTRSGRLTHPSLHIGSHCFRSIECAPLPRSVEVGAQSVGDDEEIDVFCPELSEGALQGRSVASHQLFQLGVRTSDELPELLWCHFRQFRPLSLRIGPDEPHVGRRGVAEDVGAKTRSGEPVERLLGVVGIVVEVGEADDDSGEEPRIGQRGADARADAPNRLQLARVLGP